MVAHTRSIHWASSRLHSNPGPPGLESRFQSESQGKSTASACNTSGKRPCWLNQSKWATAFFRNWLCASTKPLGVDTEPPLPLKARAMATPRWRTSRQ